MAGGLRQTRTPGRRPVLLSQTGKLLLFRSTVKRSGLTFAQMVETALHQMPVCAHQGGQDLTVARQRA